MAVFHSYGDTSGTQSSRDGKRLVTVGVVATDKKWERFDRRWMAVMREFGGVFVPDTNALLYNPALESWRFNVDGRFVVVLTPTVLSELIALKTKDRNDQVRAKAERLIRVIELEGYLDIVKTQTDYTGRRASTSLRFTCG
jgi:hypothetical protein